MSMSLILWKAPVVDDPEQAKGLLVPWYVSGDDSGFEPSVELAAVTGQLLARYPFDPEDETSPWAEPPQDTGRLLVLAVRWGAESPILAEIPVLAKKHRLILYDPQGPDIFTPDEPLEPAPEPEATAWEWFKSFAIAAVFIALTYAAWLIPVGWLRWPLVFVAGFFAAAALFVVGAMFFGRSMIERDSDLR